MCPYVVVRGWPFLQSVHSVVRWGWGRGLQWAEEAGGAAGLPDSLSFRRLIGRAPLFVWVFFRKRERFALPEWNLFCGFIVLVAGDQAI